MIDCEFATLVREAQDEGQAGIYSCSWYVTHGHIGTSVTLSEWTCNACLKEEKPPTATHPLRTHAAAQHCLSRITAEEGTYPGLTIEDAVSRAKAAEFDDLLIWQALVVAFGRDRMTIQDVNKHATDVSLTQNKATKQEAVLVARSKYGISVEKAEQAATGIGAIIAVGGGR